jgi:hypothetical protein
VLTSQGRTTLVHDVSPVELLYGYQPGQNEFEAETCSVVVLAVFDHDYLGQHLLVQEWDGSNEQPRWGYVLVFLTPDPVVVHRFAAPYGQIPWVQAATLVACWSQNGHWDGAALHGSTPESLGGRDTGGCDTGDGAAGSA